MESEVSPELFAVQVAPLSVVTQIPLSVPTQNAVGVVRKQRGLAVTVVAIVH